MSEATAAFSASVSGKSVSVNGSTSKGTFGSPIISYAWQFGDRARGETTEKSTCTIKYPGEGEYEITLTITDQLGKKASATQKVEIKAIASPAPTASPAPAPAPHPTPAPTPIK